jgi:ribosomal protein L32
MMCVIESVFARSFSDSHPLHKLAVAAGCANWHLEHPVCLKTSAAKAKRISGFEFCKRLIIKTEK